MGKEGARRKGDMGEQLGRASGGCVDKYIYRGIQLKNRIRKGKRGE